MTLSNFIHIALEILSDLTIAFNPAEVAGYDV